MPPSQIKPKGTWKQETSRYASSPNAETFPEKGMGSIANMTSGEIICKEDSFSWSEYKTHASYS